MGIPRDHHFSQIYDYVRLTGPPVCHVMFMSGSTRSLTAHIIGVPLGSQTDESVPSDSLDCMCSIEYTIVVGTSSRDLNGKSIDT